MMQIFSPVIIVGIVLAIFTSILWNVAPIIQKEALATMSNIDATNALANTKTLFKNSRWLVGFIMAIGGGLTYIIAIQMGGIVIVQPLMNFGLIVLVILANRRLGEVIDGKAIAGILLLICMPFFIAYGGVTEPTLFVTYDNFIVYSIALLAGIGAMIPGTKKKPLLWAPITSFLQGLAALNIQWATLAVFAADDLFQGFLHGLIPLILTGVFTFVAGVYTVSIGLQNNPAARFNSTVGTISTFAVVLGGLMIFNQVITNPIFYLVGFIFGILAVGLLSKYQDSAIEQAISEAEGESDYIGEETDLHYSQPE